MKKSGRQSSEGDQANKQSLREEKEQMDLSNIENYDYINGLMFGQRNISQRGVDPRFHSHDRGNKSHVK